MKNIEQCRAANALTQAYLCRKREHGDCLPRYPGLIINNGLIATLAFAIEKSIGERNQWWHVSTAIAKHLQSLNIVKNKQSHGTENQPDTNADSLLKTLINDADSLLLRRATDEAIAYLGYLKRFAKAHTETNEL